MRSKADRLVAPLAGLLLALAFCPGPYGWLAWVSPALLLLSIHERRPRQAFLRGWAFGFAAWAAGMLWLPAVLSRTLGAPPPAALALHAAVCAYLGLMHALLALGVAAIAPRLAAQTGRSLALWESAVAVPLFAAIEGFFPMLFPNQLANTQYFHLPLAQSADLFGMGGLCWLVMGVNAAVFVALVSPPRRRAAALAAAALVLGLNEAYGLRRIAQVDAAARAAASQGRVLRAALLQGGMPLRERFGPGTLQRNLAVYDALIRDAYASGPVDLLIEPENAYERELSFAAADRELRSPEIDGAPAARALSRDLPPLRSELLLGAVGVTRPRTRRYYLSVLVGADRGVRGLSAKRERTPLGELPPWGDSLTSLDRFAPRGLWLLHRGPRRLLETASGARLGVYICYEALLEPAARELALAGAELLINPANNDEFAAGVEAGQNLRLGAMRAIETRRFVLRPSAFSAAIDPAGRIVSRLSRGARGVLRVDAPLLSLETPFLRVGRLPYALGALLTLALGAAASLGLARLRALAQLARLGDLWVPFATTATLLGVNAAGARPEPGRVGAALAANLLGFAFCFMYNDLEDADDDARNPVHARRNPVAAGRLSRAAAAPACAAAAAASLACYAWLGRGALALGAPCLALGWLYSWRRARLKRLPGVDVVVHAYCWGLAQFLCGYLAVSSDLRRAWGLAAMIAAVSVYGELFNQTRDLDSDRRAGLAHTTARLGLRLARAAQWALLAAAVCLLFSAVQGRVVPFWVARWGAAIEAAVVLAALGMRPRSLPELLQRLHMPTLAASALLMAVWTALL